MASTLLVFISPAARGYQYYVSTNGNDGYDGLSWDTAVLTISQAVKIATLEGDKIIISNGVHNIGAEIFITNGIVLQGFGGRTQTVVRRGGPAAYRLFRVMHTNAVLEGLELREGNEGVSDGGAALMTAGTLRDCNVISNSGIHGGALYLGGSCLVSNCFIAGNQGVHGGGAIYMAAPGAMVTHCVISSNRDTYYTGGGGVWMTAGTVRNCLIVRNRVTLNGPGQGGGGVVQSGGALLNCTVAGNQVMTGNNGGGVWRSGGAITNTIIYGNARGLAVDNLSASAQTGIGYSCAPELVAGTNGNIAADPDFTDMSNDNYRLSPGSPCIDAGVDLADWTADLDGINRPLEGDGLGAACWDMGAYEAEAIASGALRCSFTGAPLIGLAPVSVVFQSFVAGADTNGLIYNWDVDGDGTNDYGGAGFTALTNEYAPGIYDVVLTVSNAAQPPAQKLKYAYIMAKAQSMYVSTGGAHTLPYTNWTMAATSLAAVLPLAGDGTTIAVTDGVYACSAQMLDRATVLRSINGETATTLRNPTGTIARLLVMSHTGAVVQGFTLTGGKSTESGGAIYMTGGTVRDCTVAGNDTSAYGAGADGGGGVFMSGGALRDCVITSNSATIGGGLYLNGPVLVSNSFIIANKAEHGGGGINMAAAGALVTHSAICGNTNTYYSGGGGIRMSAGTVRNCLVAGNWVTRNSSDIGGGGVNQSGGALLNCTVAGNRTLTVNKGGGVWWTAGAVTNTIIHGNLRGGSADDLTAASQSTIGYSCAPELGAGTNGNIVGDPNFVDMSNGNYRLAPGSPCIDAGTNMTEWTLDLDGISRPQEGDGLGDPLWDMGAYEVESTTSGVLRCGFNGSPLLGMAPLPVVFQASVAGADTNGLTYFWDVNGDGTNEYDETGLTVLTNEYAPGIYDVALTVSNAAQPPAHCIKLAYVTAQAQSMFVASDGSHTLPYTNWTMAATNLAAVMPLAGDGTTIAVTDGVYDCSGLMLDHGTVLHSVNGPEATTLRNPPGTIARLLILSHTGAAVEGFTLTGGKSAESGGAIYMTAGAVRDCNVASNDTSAYGAGSDSGGGIYITGGAIHDCRFTNNSATVGGALALSGSCLISNCLVMVNKGVHGAGGIYVAASGALVTHCIVNNNTNVYYNGGGGLWVNGGEVRNCLVAGNRTTYNTPSAYGGGVNQSAGVLINCTIVSNQSVEQHAGGGMYRSGGALTNCVVWDNWRGTVQEDLAGTSGVRYSCARELAEDDNGNIARNPVFRDPGAGDYRLKSGSPCIDRGIELPWMAGAADLDGKRRVISGEPDMGAYETDQVRGVVLLLQ